MRTAPKKDVYQIITDRIVSQIETGVSPWNQPWAKGELISRPLRFNGQPYRGINVLVLWAMAMTKGYDSATWMTYKQATDLGGQVRKGETAEMVVYFTKINVQDQASGEDKNIPLLRYYSVFNVEQIDNLPAKFYAKNEYEQTHKERILEVDAFFDNTGAKVQHLGSNAFYSPSEDQITLPDFVKFKDAHAYYATRGHETVHWTRHETRLNRLFGAHRFGDEGYAMEELVAEIGAAFLCADLHIALTARDDHAKYMAHWLKVLKDDKKAVFTAASAAEKAVSFLHALQPSKQDGSEETEAEVINEVDLMRAA